MVADVCVVGGGLVGLLTAHALAEAGKRVVLLEARDVGGSTTGFSTAKFTTQHGLKYSSLPPAEAAAYAAANMAGLAYIAEVVERGGIECDWSWRSHSVFAEDAAMVDALAAEAAAATAAGIPEVALLDALPDLPQLDVKAAVHFGMQAQANVYQLCVALAGRLAAGGRVALHEGSRAKAVPTSAPPHRVVTDGGSVTAGAVVLATHLPFLDRSAHFAVTEPSRSYCIAARLSDPRALPTQMAISAEQPTKSLRVAPIRGGGGAGDDVLIVAGFGHPMGSGVDTRAPYAELEAWARARWPVAEVAARWSAFDYVSADGKPYVGRLSRATEGLFTATAFGKWGLTWAGASALLLRDAITGAPPPEWAGAFDAARWDVVRALPGMLKEQVRRGRPVRSTSAGGCARALSSGNPRHPPTYPPTPTPNTQAQVVAHFAGDRLAALAAPDIRSLAPGEGGVVTFRGRPVVAYRDAATGATTAHKPVCTHLGCYTRFNPAEKTVDCACHGSRFDAVTGAVLHGPAVEPLEAVPLDW